MRRMRIASTTSGMPPSTGTVPSWPPATRPSSPPASGRCVGRRFRTAPVRRQRQHQQHLLRDNSAVYQASFHARWTGERHGQGDHQRTATTPLLERFRCSRRTAAANPDLGRKRRVAFPTTAQKSALARSTGVAPVTGDQNVAYILGRPSLEKRKAGNPAQSHGYQRQWPGARRHRRFSPAYSTDSKSLFVGANDGMLHAFDSATGREQFLRPAGLRFSGTAGLGAGDPQYGAQLVRRRPVVVSTMARTRASTTWSDHWAVAAGHVRPGRHQPVQLQRLRTCSGTGPAVRPSRHGPVLGEPLISR